MPELTISDDAFLSTFAPIKNHLAPDAPWDGCMFETYGEEYQEVLNAMQTDRRKIWTILEGDDGAPVIVSGHHFVNRLGYLITTHPAAENIDYVVVEDDRG